MVRFTLICGPAGYTREFERLLRTRSAQQRRRSFFLDYEPDVEKGDLR